MYIHMELQRIITRFNQISCGQISVNAENENVNHRAHYSICLTYSLDSGQSADWYVILGRNTIREKIIVIRGLSTQLLIHVKFCVLPHYFIVIFPIIYLARISLWKEASEDCAHSPSDCTRLRAWFCANNTEFVQCLYHRVYRCFHWSLLLFQIIL